MIEFLTVKLNDFWDGARLRLLRVLIRFYWWCDFVLENAPHPRQKKHIFFEPISTTAILVSLAVSAASFSAQYLITRLTAPKPRPEIKGKLTGDITLTDSIFGFVLPRIYGGRPEDGIGGIEVGGNIIWASDIRKIQTTVPSGNGGGGKGAPKPPPNIQINYKVDLAIAAADARVGRQRLLRVKFNEDVVYSITGGGGTGPVIEGYEAEDPGNTLLGGASVAADEDCSGGEKVTGIGLGGSLEINDVFVSELLRPEDPPGGENRPYLSINVRYKSAGDKFCYVKQNGSGGVFSFPDSSGNVASRFLLFPYNEGSNSIEFSHPTQSAPEIDAIQVSVIYIFEPFPTGVLNINFPPEEPQDNLLLPDPKTFDTNPRERYNLIAAPDEAGVLEVTLPNGTAMAWYDGAADQPTDAVIAANIDTIYGAGSCPAFRDTAYARFQNLDFTKYGSIPAIRLLIENMDNQTVSEICLAEASLAGLGESFLDLAAGEEKHIRGLYVQNIEAPASIFEDVALIHNLTFIENSDGKIAAKDLSDRTPVTTITKNDLGAFIAEESDTPPVDRVVEQIPDLSTDVIQTLELQFNSPTAPSNGDTARVSYTYPYTDSVRKETRQINAVLTEEEANGVVRREVQIAHLKLSPLAFTLPHKFAWLEPADVVNLEVSGGEFKKVRLEEKTGSAPGIYECTATSEDIYVLSGDPPPLPGDTKADTQTVKVPANTVGTILDIPPLEDAQGVRVGVYAAACSRDQTSGEWSGCTLYRFKGTDYQKMTSFDKPSTIGVVVNALPDWTETEVDDANSLTVDLFGDAAPTSVLSEQAEDGANAIVVGSEIMTVQTWTRDNDYPNRWIGTDIFRRLKNTEEKAAEHVAGERVVFLDDSVKFIPLDASEKEIERNWKFVTFGQRIEDASRIAFTWAGENDFNKAKDAPVIGQISNASTGEILIGVKNYTRDARFRRIEISPNSDMSASILEIVSEDDYPHSVLPTEFLVTRDVTGEVTVPATSFYISVSHSSNGMEFGALSDILEVTFSDDSDLGGSTGGFTAHDIFSVEVDG